MCLSQCDSPSHHTSPTHLTQHLTPTSLSHLAYDAPTFRVALSTWRAAKSARLFVAVRERTHLLTVLGEEVPTDLTASVEKATTPGVDGEGKEKGSKGEELEEEAEECTKRARLEEAEQSSNDGPSKGDSVVTFVDQTSGEDKNDEMTGRRTVAVLTSCVTFLLVTRFIHACGLSCHTRKPCLMAALIK